MVACVRMCRCMWIRMCMHTYIMYTVYACIVHIVHYVHMYVTILYVICMCIVQMIFVRIQSKIEPIVK